MQKKCFIASAATHLLLALILLIGPAFLSSKNKTDDLPVLDFIPSRLIDAPFSGGGNPNAQPPPPAPPVVTPPQPATPPPPKPPEVKVTQEKPAPTPPKDAIKSPEADPISTKPKIQINTRLVTRNNDSKAKEKAQAEAQAQALADAKRRTDQAFGRTIKNLRMNLSSSTTVDILGPGGEAYANYAQIVKSVYTQAWIVPDEIAEDDATAKVTVTIARDGTVISARVLRPSGSAPVDKSVQHTLERVKFVAPFPEGAKEEQRSFTINFNLKARRLLG